MQWMQRVWKLTSLSPWLTDCYEPAIMIIRPNKEVISTCNHCVQIHERRSRLDGYCCLFLGRSTWISVGGGWARQCPFPRRLTAVLQRVKVTMSCMGRGLSQISECIFMEFRMPTAFSNTGHRTTLGDLLFMSQSSMLKLLCHDYIFVGW